MAATARKEGDRQQQPQPSHQSGREHAVAPVEGAASPKTAKPVTSGVGQQQQQQQQLQGMPVGSAATAPRHQQNSNSQGSGLGSPAPSVGQYAVPQASPGGQEAWANLPLPEVFGNVGLMSPLQLMEEAIRDPIPAVPINDAAPGAPERASPAAAVRSGGQSQCNQGKRWGAPAGSKDAPSGAPPSAAGAEPAAGEGQPQQHVTGAASGVRSPAPAQGAVSKADLQDALASVDCFVGTLPTAPSQEPPQAASAPAKLPVQQSVAAAGVALAPGNSQQACAKIQQACAAPGSTSKPGEPDQAGKHGTEVQAPAATRATSSAPDGGQRQVESADAAAGGVRPRTAPHIRGAMPPSNTGGPPQVPSDTCS